MQNRDRRRVQTQSWKKYIMLRGGIGMSYFGMLLISGIDNGCTTNFSKFFSIPVESPATYFRGRNGVFDEMDSPIETNS